ncbi:unnamed protein product [Linum trigynum]|uniref:Transposase n=1 Tax=Linum trigynum TaxID=586398 RepID=A0AAV2D4P8_9ROSI
MNSIPLSRIAVAAKKTRTTIKRSMGRDAFRRDWTACYLEASDQKFKRNEGNAVNQLMNAIAVAVSNWTQWFCLQLPRSLSISTVIPAEAQAAANVSVEVT